MSPNLTKRAAARPSQILPKPLPESAPNVTLGDTYVILCDWHGRVVWISGTGERLKIGEEIWRGVAGKSKERLKTAVASVASLGEQQTLEVENERHEHFRLRMWPLNEPDFAICLLAVQIPSEIALLTERERACLVASLRACPRGKSLRNWGSVSRPFTRTCGAAARNSGSRVRRRHWLCGANFYVPQPSITADSAASRKRSG